MSTELKIQTDGDWFYVVAEDARGNRDVWARCFEEAQARRLVACVAACEGLSTEQLEAMAGSGTIKSALDDPMGFAVARAYLNGENLEDLVRRAIAKLEGK